MKHLKNRVAILLAVILILTACAVGFAEEAQSVAIDKAGTSCWPTTSSAIPPPGNSPR